MIGSRGIPGQHGGVERVLEAVCPRLVELGDEVRVYTTNKSTHPESHWRGVEIKKIFSIPHKYFDTLSRSFFATLFEILKPNTIVHYHASGSAPLAILPRLFGKKVIVTVHGLDWQRKKWNAFGEFFLRFGEWAACRFPHKTIVVSQNLKDYLDPRYRTNVIYIPNGVEDRPYRAPDKIRAWGLESRSYILYLGRIVPEKGCDVLIDGFLGIKDRRGLKLVIAGPMWHSKDYAELLKKKAQGHADIVFPGEVDEATLEELYSNCCVYSLPSEVEGMSLSLLDAMAFSACILASDIPANADVIRDAGVTFRVKDPRDLSEKLQGLIMDPARAEDLRKKARQRMTSEFHWDKVARRWQDVYDSL